MPRQKKKYKEVRPVPDYWSTENVHLDVYEVHLTVCIRWWEPALNDTLGSPEKNFRKQTRTAGDSERNDETATALTTADIPSIVAEVLHNVTNSGDLSKDNADDDNPATQDEDGSSGKDKGIDTYLLYLYCYCVSRDLAHRVVAVQLVIIACMLASYLLSVCIKVW